jgi:hypothetical protein
VGEAVLRGLLAESAKEQDSASRRGRWCVPGGRTVVSRALVCCCWESEAIASVRKQRRRSERSYVEGLRSESAKEQDSARRGGKWCSPEGEV